jgi:hypothetical protein
MNILSTVLSGGNSTLLTIQAMLGSGISQTISGAIILGKLKNGLALQIALMANSLTPALQQNKEIKSVII